MLACWRDSSPSYSKLQIGGFYSGPLLIFLRCVLIVGIVSLPGTWGYANDDGALVAIQTNEGEQPQALAQVLLNALTVSYIYNIYIYIYSANFIYKNGDLKFYTSIMFVF